MKIIGKEQNTLKYEGETLPFGGGRSIGSNNGAGVSSKT